MTTVANIIVDETGDPLSGVEVEVSLLSSGLVALSAAFVGNSQIASIERTHTNASGIWQLDLFPNVDITPAGTIYRAVQMVDTGDLTVDFVVPAAGATPGTIYVSTILV